MQVRDECNFNAPEKVDISLTEGEDPGRKLADPERKVHRSLTGKGAVAVYDDKTLRLTGHRVLSDRSWGGLPDLLPPREHAILEYSYLSKF